LYDPRRKLPTIAATSILAWDKERPSILMLMCQ
jgi:hypothetical protein